MRLRSWIPFALVGCMPPPRPSPLPPSAPAVSRATPPPVPMPTASCAPSDYPIRLERHVAAVMRDGTKLYADIYRPKAEGRFPVIMERNPYDRQGSAELGVRGATSGFVVVLQDVRGRYESEGEWYPLKHEADDGYDTVEWAASLPYANGHVGMIGASYRGAAALLAATKRPPHLGAIHALVSPADPHEGWIYQGGAFGQWGQESWASGVLVDSLRRRLATTTNPMDWAKKLPLSSYPIFEPGSPSALAGYLQDWLAHPAADAYWRALSVEDHYEAIDVPVYHLGGWYDAFLGSTLRSYVGLRLHAGSEVARREQRLVVGPWNHIDSPGEVNFGEAADTLDVAELPWFAQVLSGKPNACVPQKPVQLFVMGKNVWRGEDAWPLERAREKRYFLGANGALGEQAVGGDGSDSFVYDPEDPVPTRGGGLAGDPRLPAGPVDQRPIESRRDVLVYTTAAFDQDMEVTGPVSVDLYVSSTAKDTDFTAKLVDVWPNGFAQNLTDGIVRMRFHKSREIASFLEKGAIYEVRIDLAGTSNVFLAGHKMRVDVSSSNFPRFDRNLNTEESPERGTKSTKATNTVYHDAARPSGLLVQIVPAEGN